MSAVAAFLTLSLVAHTSCQRLFAAGSEGRGLLGARGVGRASVSRIRLLALKEEPPFWEQLLRWTGFGSGKEELLALVADSQRGLDASKNDAIIAAFEALERSNPTPEPLESPRLRGEWELLWTTSPSILGAGRPFFFRPEDSKPILQFLDPKAGYARNLEYTPLGPNRVEASIAALTPEQKEAFTSKLDDFLLFKMGSQDMPGGTYMPKDDRLERNTVGVRFQKFTLFGILPIPAPASATGILQVTYLDDDLRLSRGDRGNLFVLRKVSQEKTD